MDKRERAPESFPPRLAPQLPQLIRALKRWPAPSNEPEVTPLLHLWQGLPRWKLDDLEAACRCGESGRGVGEGTKRGCPLQQTTTGSLHAVYSVRRRRVT